MKTVRRYASRTFYVVLWVAIAPLAIAIVVFRAPFVFCLGILDSLEEMANDR